jgi:hypothetical protein
MQIRTTNEKEHQREDTDWNAIVQFALFFYLKECDEESQETQGCVVVKIFLANLVIASACSQCRLCVNIN